MNNVYKRIALLGAIGNPNIGDEAILEANIQKLKEMYGDNCEIYVFTKDATYTSLNSGKGSNIIATSYLNQFTAECGYNISCMKEKERELLSLDTTNLKYKSLHEIFRKIDALHIIGGGFLNSLWPDMLYEVCLATKFAKLYHKKYCFTGISIFPFDPQYNNDLLEAFEGASFVDFRDNSYKYLQNNKMNDTIFSTCDDAVSVQGKEVDLKLNKYATIAIHEWYKNTDITDNIKNCLIPFMKQCISNGIVQGFYILGFSGGDLNLWNDLDLEEIKDHVIFKDLYLNGEILETKYIVGNAVFNIGSRYHQAVFSLSSNVPVLSISYDDYYQNKLESIHSIYQSSCVIKGEEFSEEILNDFVSKLDCIKEEISKQEASVRKLEDKKDEYLEKFYGSMRKQESKEYTTPYITVIIPVYNAEKYLRECLDSVTSQSLKNIEILCVNDGSKDTSEAILAEYANADKRMKILYHENKGVGYSRNRAIQEATGEYLYFLVSDDTLPDENVLSDMYYAAKKNDVLVCGGSFSERYPDYTNYIFRGVDSKFAFNNDGLMEYKDYQFDFGWTRFIYSRELIVSNHLSIPGLCYFEDPVFFVRVMHLAKKFYHLQRITYAYRLGHKANKMSYKQVLDFLEGIKMNVSFAIENHYDELLALEIYRLNHYYKYIIDEYTLKEENIELRNKLDEIYALTGETRVVEDKPCVSIVMPIYNASKFLEQSLGSVQNQTLKNIEIICVNDGSKDNSLAILEEHAKNDKRIRIIDGTNHGYGYAMNRGIEIATGEYIGIVEPDDFIDTNMYESLYNIAVRNDVDVVKSNYYEYKGNDNTNTFVEVLAGLPYSCITSAKENKRMITTRPCIWSSIYKREFLIRNNIKFNETPGASYQDTAFSFNVWVLAERVYFVKEPFLHYRIDNENSSVNSTGKIFSICDEFQKIETILNANQELKETYKPMLQVLKLNTYRWNEGRIAEEYKAYFRDQTALELMKAEYEGYLDRNLFDDYQKEYLEKIMYEYKEKQKYDAYIFNEYHVMLNSESWKIGHGLVLAVNKVRNIFHKK